MIVGVLLFVLLFSFVGAQENVSEGGSNTADSYLSKDVVVPEGLERVVGWILGLGADYELVMNFFVVVVFIWFFNIFTFRNFVWLFSSFTKLSSWIGGLAFAFLFSVFGLARIVSTGLLDFVSGIAVIAEFAVLQLALALLILFVIYFVLNLVLEKIRKSVFKKRKKDEGKRVGMMFTKLSAMSDARGVGIKP